MDPRRRIQTLTQRTQERRRASCRCVRRGKCRSMKMRVSDTERTSSPHVNITASIQPRGGSWRANANFEIKRHFQNTLWPRTGSRKMVRLMNHNLKQRVGSWEKKKKKDRQKVLGATIHETQGLLERIIALPHGSPPCTIAFWWFCSIGQTPKKKKRAAQRKARE